MHKSTYLISNHWISSVISEVVEKESGFPYEVQVGKQSVIKFDQLPVNIVQFNC